MRDLLASLPTRQREVAEALLADSWATYPRVAAQLGISLGTVHRHLERIRRLRPEVYEAVMACRADHLRERRRQSEDRRRQRTERWYQTYVAPRLRSRANAT